AQDLRPDVLEELRLLSNLETARAKIRPSVLAGQPELDAILADPSLRQLRQRVALRIRLRPLSPPEVAAYVRARVERVGGTAAELFPPDALASLAMLSHGIPRLVNVLCDAALLGTFAAGKRAVTPAIVEDAWRDHDTGGPAPVMPVSWSRSEEHTSELQSPDHLVCRLLLEKKKKILKLLKRFMIEESKMKHNDK